MGKTTIAFSVVIQYLPRYTPYLLGLLNAFGRERAHLDTTIADLKASNGLLRHEREKSKSDLATVRSQLDESQSERKNEKVKTRES